MTSQQILNRLDLEQGYCSKKKILTFARIAKKQGISDEKLKSSLKNAGCRDAELRITSSIESSVADYFINF